MNLLISIIMPVYNRPNLVTDTIKSIILQTNPNFELIIVDDQSTDNTWDILKRYARKHNRIKTYKREREPKGAPTCRNIGAKTAKGKYLIFWDSDDLMAPWLLKERLEFMKANSELDFGLFQLLNFEYNTGVYSLRCSTNCSDYLTRFLTFKNAWGTPAVIWNKTSFIKKVGFWDEDALSWQDGELHVRAILANSNFKWGSLLPDAIIRSKIDTLSITSEKYTKTKHINLLYIFSKLLPLLNSKESKAFIDAIKARIWLESYHFDLLSKKQIAQYALEKGIISISEKKEFVKKYNYYHVIKNIPGLRRFFYQNMIKKKFYNYSFFKRDKITEEDLCLFKNKLNCLPINTRNIFRNLLDSRLNSSLFN